MRGADPARGRASRGSEPIRTGRTPRPPFSRRRDPETPVPPPSLTANPHRGRFGFGLGPLPLIEALRGYRRADLAADLRASLPVAAVALPQSMAFAMLAGFDPIYGVWTAIVAGFVGALLGSSRQLVTSVNNAVCMLVASLFAVLARQHGADFDPLTAIVALALLMGVFEIVMGLVGMGDLTRFISGSVLQGFMCGTALLIAAHELGGLLGIATRQTELLPLLREVAGRLDEVRPAAVMIGLFSVAAMAVPSRWRLRLSGALLAVAGSTAAAWLLDLGPERLDMVQSIPRALPVPSLPAVSWPLFTDLVPGAMAAALLGAVEAMVISSALATRTGQEVEPRWQLVGQGCANIFSGLLRGLPCSSSFTRSFLNLKEGARTQVAAMAASVWILALVFLAGPVFAHVPKASLTGVLLVLAWRLPDWKRVRLMLRATRADGVALLATFAATLVLRLDMALFVGVIVSLALFLRKAQTPHLVEYVVDREHHLHQIEGPDERTHPAICILHVEGELFFAAADLLEREVRRIAEDPSLQVILLRMKSARHLDATGALALASIARSLRAAGKRLLVSGVSGEAEGIFKRTGIDAILGPENIFFSEAGILVSTRDALRYAESIVGPKGAEVRVFREEVAGPGRP